MSGQTATIRKASVFLLRVFAVSGVLFLLGMGPHPSWEGGLSALMIGTVLCWLVAVSTAGGVDLAIAVAGLYFIPSTVINVPEGVLFDVIPVSMAPPEMVRQLGIALIVGVTATALFGRWKAAQSPAALGLGIWGLSWRLIAAVTLFVVCYAAAGMVIFPYVKEYYQGRILPGPEPMVAMQILRALALVVIARLVLRHVRDRRAACWLLAVAFPVIGDIALMIPSNDLMPPQVRLVHALEILPYYALCGYIFAVWFGPRRNALNNGVQHA